MQNPSILGIGTALPAHRVRQVLTAAADCRLNRRVGAAARRVSEIYRNTQVLSRHSVLDTAGAGGGGSEFERFFEGTPELGTGARMRRYRIEAPSLARMAAARALTASRVPAARITHVITVSCTGFAAPGLDIALVDGLGLSRSVVRAHIGFMGCHGAFNGLSVARAFAVEDPRARILVVSAELCSLHYVKTNALDRMVANALFADGASAAVVGRGKGRFVIAGFGSRVIPGSLDAMTWSVGDSGFEMGLSARIPKLIGEQIKDWTGEWLAGLKTDPSAIRAWAIHPGGPRILESAAEALGINRRLLRWSYEVLKRNGNMSSATLLFILDAMLKSRVRGPVAAIGFGPGLTAEGMLLTS